MRFNIKDIHFKLSFTFFAVFLFYYLNNSLLIYFYAIISVLVHESIHLLLIMLCGGKIDCIKFNIFGGTIQRNSNVIISDYAEALISISAPITNIILFLLDYIIKCEITDWGAVNLVLGAINIAPYYSFDGGRFLYFILRRRYSERILFLIQFTLSLSLTIILTAFTIALTMLNKSSFILIIFNIYVIFSLFFIKS